MLDTNFELIHADFRFHEFNAINLLCKRKPKRSTDMYIRQLHFYEF